MMLPIDQLQLDQIEVQLPVLLIAALGLFIAGVLKGTTGLGYTTCALPILVTQMELRAAIVVVLIPALASNLLQMWSVGHVRETLLRFGVLYIALIPGIGYGIMLLVEIDQAIAMQTLGSLTLLYAAFALPQPGLRIAPRFERPLQLPVGLLNGVLTGLTGSQIIPLVPYMLALQLDPNRLVQAVNIAVAVASAIMGLGLIVAGLMSAQLALVSVLGILPAFAGMGIGNGIRAHIPDRAFRTLVLLVLAGMGLALAVPVSLINKAGQVVGRASAGARSPPMLGPHRDAAGCG